MLFNTINIGGIHTPNTSRTFQTFPFSFGIETNNKFNNINAIAEIGWMPWYQIDTNIPNFLKKTKFGIFLQGGYKFAADSSNSIPIGGEIDESKEKSDNAIFRIKGNIGINTKSMFHFSGVGVGLVANSDVWYDILNKEIYHKIEGKIRLFLTDNEDKYFDFQIQNFP